MLLLLSCDDGLIVVQPLVVGYCYKYLIGSAPPRLLSILCVSACVCVCVRNTRTWVFFFFTSSSSFPFIYVDNVIIWKQKREMAREIESSKGEGRTEERRVGNLLITDQRHCIVCLLVDGHIINRLSI